MRRPAGVRPHGRAPAGGRGHRPALTGHAGSVRWTVGQANGGNAGITGLRAWPRPRTNGPQPKNRRGGAPQGPPQPLCSGALEYTLRPTTQARPAALRRPSSPGQFSQARARKGREIAMACAERIDGRCYISSVILRCALPAAPCAVAARLEGWAAGPCLCHPSRLAWTARALPMRAPQDDGLGWMHGRMRPRRLDVIARSPQAKRAMRILP
jgi:hypothetical protein